MSTRAEHPNHLHWTKSSYSGSDGGDCVEVATTPDTIHVRDSKDTAGASLRFTPDAWSAFLTFTRELPRTPRSFG